MKNKTFIWNLVTMISCILIFSCDDKNKDNTGECWNEDWLIGTWEGTTPSNSEPFANTKMRIVFTESNLERVDTVPGNHVYVWAYNGTFTWDIDSATWVMGFMHNNWPTPDYNVIIFECATIYTSTMNNISLRVTDTLSTAEPSHTMNLDWEITNTGDGAPTSIDFYGDIHIYYNGVQVRAEYPPQEGSTIRMTKK